MKAVVQDRYGDAGTLRVEDVPAPQAGPGEVLVRVDAASLHLGDVHMMTGRPLMVHVMGLGLRRPKQRVKGSDFAGRVEALGPDVEGLAVGDAVYGVGDGSLAELVVARATGVGRAPHRLTPAQAAAVPTSAVTALQAVRDVGQVRPGHRVLVLGAGGGVGAFAVQIAASTGARVTGVCSTGKLEAVRALGADQVLDYTVTDVSDGTRRYDVVIDTAGHRSLRALRRTLTPRGTVVLVGGETGGRWVGGFDRQLRALLLSPFGRQRLRPMIAVTRAADLEALATLVDAGSVTPLVGATYRLDEAAAAMDHLAQGHATGKVVVVVRP